VEEFEGYLDAQREGKDLQEVGAEDLEAFVLWIEEAPKASAKTHLWALRHYYEYVADDAMRSLAGALREERIKRTPFALKKFQGVDPEYVGKIEAAGVKNVAQMLKAGQTHRDRQVLAEETGVPIDAILEFVKLSDLARIPGIKGIRARLYHDAGVDTIEKLAACDPVELRAMLAGFVEDTGFEEQDHRRGVTEMEPKVMDREGFTVIGMKYRGKNENNEIPQLWQELGPRVEEIKNMVGAQVAYGICANTDMATGEFDYIAGFEVSSAEALPEGMVSFEVPGGRYALFTTTLPKIGETFHNAYQAWLPQAGYQPTGGPEFELYDERFDPQDPDSTFELYIPIG
jgi:AraC family transcriptional regulator